MARGRFRDLARLTPSNRQPAYSYRNHGDHSMNVWVVRVKRHSELQSLAMENGILAIGWAQLSNLARFRDQEEIDRQLRHHDPEKGRRASSNQSVQLWDFVKNITVGDLVIVPLDGRLVSVGLIASDYSHRGERAGTGRHARHVEWLLAELPMERLPPGLPKKIDSNQRTVFRLGSDEDAAQIRAAIETEHATRG